MVSNSLHSTLAFNKIIEGYGVVVPLDSTPAIPTSASPTPDPASTTPTTVSTSTTPDPASTTPTTVSTSTTPTPVSPTPAPSPSTSPISNEDRVIVGYYPDWRSSQLAVNNLFWDKLTHINYAFALMNDSFSPVITTGPNLNTLVWYAHTFNVKCPSTSKQVLLAIGGWTGSKTFSTMVATPESRAVFINATMSLINQYSLDGVDIDWEYPGRKGAICNVVNTQNDTSNFLSLLKELRAAVGNKLLTIAVRAETLDGPNGPITDVSGFASVVDWVNIMAYDMAVDDHSNEPWTKITGPNAPFNVTSGQGRQLSFTQSINTWLQSGMPASKIVMGVEFIGRALTATDQMSDSQYVGRDSTVPKGDQSDALWAEPCPGASQAYSGVWTWRNLRQQGLLECTMSAAKNTPWTRYFDNVTNTPWLFNSETKTYISYDDPQSLYIKTEYVKSQNLRGMMIWELTTDNGKELLNVVQSLKQSSSAAPTNDCSSTAAYNPDGAPATDSSNEASGSESPKSKKVGAGIAVGIAFSLAAFAALCMFGFIWYRRRRAAVSANESGPGSASALVGAGAGVQYKDCVIALFDFKAVRKNDLSFKKGDIIEVLDKGNGENSWWIGRINGDVGEFPGK
ncbi:1057_t:CDS:2 [Paraglomus occultum]|uniref:1057_t:CDS:1 n=1 Tax=Paraglomus occultum TaxID=144539 RepID=A0A9N9BEK9_9GLOM|nr:1057_t:CDS:2 [Paraglomus occultum]